MKGVSITILIITLASRTFVESKVLTENKVETVDFVPYSELNKYNNADSTLIPKSNEGKSIDDLPAREGQRVVIVDVLPELENEENKGVVDLPEYSKEIVNVNAIIGPEITEEIKKGFVAVVPEINEEIIAIVDVPDIIAEIENIGKPEPETEAEDDSEAEIVFLANGCPEDFTIHWLVPAKNCNEFFYCFGDKKVLTSCGDILHFNPELQVCDWPQNAGCEAGNN